MNPSLALARFRYDDAAALGLTLRSPRHREWPETHALSQNVRIGDRVLPRLHAALMAAAARLAADVPVQGFVFASADPNALCVTGGESGRVLVFLSSSLVQLFDEQEMLFVLGHELGHALFEHHRHPVLAPAGEDASGRARILELCRYAEFSADRAGWLAVQDTDVAIRAMLKSASGLSAAALEVDVNAFLSQIDELRSSGGDEHILYSTHPPLALRARALLRAETSLRALLQGTDAQAGLRQLDRMIQRELDTAACGYDGGGVAERGRTAAFWRMAWALCRKGELTLGGQQLMEDAFGPDRVDALRRLMRATPDAPDRMRKLEERMQASRTEVSQAPSLVERVYEDCLERYRDRIAGL